MHDARILVVEDENIVAKDIQAQLQKQGYRVAGITAYGHEAIKMAVELKPDIVLMDIKLAGNVDGVEAALTIRRETGLPIIYMTAYANEEIIQRAKVTEPSGYIFKPIRMGELRTSIEMALYKHGIEKKIIESESKYRMLVESMSEGLIICDTKGSMTFVNNAFCQMLGYGSDDLTGRNLLDVLDEPSKKIMRNQWTLRRRGINDPYELTFKKTNGNSLFARISPRGVFDKSGQFNESFGLITDITRQKSMEEVANIQRGLSQALSATSDLKVALALCVEGILLAANMDIGAIYLNNFDNNELKLCYSKGFPANFLKKAKCFADDSTFTRLVSHGKPVWTTYTAYGKRLFGSATEKRFKALALIPIFFKRKIVACVMIISKQQTDMNEFERSAAETISSQMGDVITRLQTEEALRASEDLHRTMIDSLDDIIHIVDQDSRITLYNKALVKWARRSGYNAEFFHHNIFKIFPFLSQNIRQEYHKVFESGKTLITEETTRVNGKTIITETRKIPLFEDKKVKFVITVIRDISARKKAEGHIRILTQELLKTQENERQRIARDLHDHIAQDLLSVKIGLEMLCEKQEAGKTVKDKVGQISSSLQNTIHSVRDISYYLGPLGLDQLGLVRTLADYVSDFGKKNNIKIIFSAAGMDRLYLEFETQINIYRIVQEALYNIKKHAGANQVIVRLIYSHPTIILKIQDNGTGFDVEKRVAEAIQEKRMGLRSMEERAGILGGIFNIACPPNQGTHITVEIPKRES